MFRVPDASELSTIGEELGTWQPERWPGCLHPGDLGWHSMKGAVRTATDLRIWEQDERMLALGMLDGPDLLRLAIRPSEHRNQEIAAEIRRDLSESEHGVFDAEVAIAEVRGAPILEAALREHGWIDDEPWIPLQLDLGDEIDAARPQRANLRIEAAGVQDAETWISVHWSSFKGIPLGEEDRARFVGRWQTMATGPFADVAQHLIAYDAADRPVAVTSVWSAGVGRPGLIEPMGVHNDQRGRGYGVAITIAGAMALRARGSSSAAVVAEGSNPGALATYESAGFRKLTPVRDLKRPGST